MYPDDINEIIPRVTGDEINSHIFDLSPIISKINNSISVKGNKVSKFMLQKIKLLIYIQLSYILISIKRKNQSEFSGKESV